MAQASQIIEGFGHNIESGPQIIAPDAVVTASRQFGNGSVFDMVSGFIPVGLGVTMAASIDTSGVVTRQQPVVCTMT